MKRIITFLFVMLFMSFALPVFSANPPKSDDFKNLSAKFIYHLPDDNDAKSVEDTNSNQEVIQSDDVTADTSEGAETNEDEDTITLDSDEDSDSPVIDKITVEDNYALDDMYSDVLQGYASFDDYTQDSVDLDQTTIDSDKKKIIIKKPTKVNSQKYVADKYSNGLNFSTLNKKDMAYSISPVYASNIDKKGGFSAGTTYSQYIDTSELEQSTMFFSKYDSKYFSLTAAYAKTVNSTNSDYNDNVYLTPELKVNQYFSLKENLSTDLVTNKKKAEFILSINPFGNKNQDTLRFELGTNATFGPDNEMMKNQFKFSTLIKL